MTRQKMRGFALVFIFVIAVSLVWTGDDGWLIMGLPTRYFGYLVGAIGVAAVLGLNIWSGGPLDPRDDPPERPGGDGTGAG